ncbi:hypothetical protein ACFVZN_02105, partial [Streptomyces virginiae]
MAAMAAQTGPARVVVTGLGVLTPIGTTVAGFWDAAVRGVVGTGPLTRPDAADFPAALAGEVAGFDAPRAGGGRSLALARAGARRGGARGRRTPWGRAPETAGRGAGHPRRPPPSRSPAPS